MPRPAAIPAATLRTAAAAETVPGRAVLYRDVWGVPHVYAAVEEDGYFGLGYAQADDQLERLLGQVRWFRGERAAVDGERALAWDGFQRMWRHREEAETGWSRLDPQVQANYRSFVAGVERFMADHPERVPEAAIDLEPLDLVLLPRALFFLAYQGVQGLADCIGGGVEIDPRIAFFADGAGATASNGWAVAPRRTADRATIVLADPHVETGEPIYWEYRVHAGDLHSSGFAMGALLWQAHTRDLSWAMTTGSPDVADCYAIETDPANPRRYRYDGEWLEMETATERIGVAGGDTVERVFEYTRHGGVRSPVVARKAMDPPPGSSGAGNAVAWGNRAWVVSVAAMHDGGLLDQEIHRMNHARSVAEARSAMELLGMFPQTVIVGDRSGGLFFVRAGKSPRRPAGFEWSKPVDGSSTASAWQGFHQLADHVQTLDPPAGFVLDTNNAPDASLRASNIETSALESFPDYLVNDTPGRTTWRGLVALEALAGREAFSWEDATGLALDETWRATQRWQVALRRTVAAFPQVMAKEPELAAWFARLLRFDGRADARSSEALAFWYFRQGLYRSCEQAGIAISDGPSFRGDELDDRLLGVVLEHARTAHAAWVEAGGEKKTLGDLFRIGRGGDHPIGGVTIDEPAIPDCRARLSPFCDVTERALRADPPGADGRRRVTRGSQALRLVQFTDPIRSFTLHPYGQSQVAGSPHYDDQSRLASLPRLKPTYFDRSDLLQHLESVRVLDTGRLRNSEPSADDSERGGRR
jgi:acyl-homoserine lactone acylase PvdQ